MEKVLPTRGQLERQISQTLQSSYRDGFGHLPSKISCHLFDDKVAIVAENTITNIERVLLDNLKIDLAVNIRSALSKTFLSQIKEEIADILKVEVTEMISNWTLDTGYLGIMIFLDDSPKVRVTAKECRKYQSIVNTAVEITSETTTSISFTQN